MMDILNEDIEVINARADINSLKDKIEQLVGKIHIEEQTLLSLGKEKSALQGDLIQLEKDKTYLVRANENLAKDQTKLRIDNDNIREEMVRSRTECDRIIAQSQEVSADIYERTIAVEVREKTAKETGEALNLKLAEASEAKEQYEKSRNEIEEKHRRVLEALK